jgi:carboxymethylenebutenolidase
MCFDHDSHPPIRPIAGGALDAGPLTLTSADGTVFNAFRARAAAPTGAGMIVLPDVRGLFPFYEELALRFAEQGVDAVAIDYFGRTAGTAARPADFEFMPHVNGTTFAGLSADIAAAAAYLRSPDGGGVTQVFTIGFCFGGRVSFDAATLGLGFAGVIGFYGPPLGPGRNDAPAPADVADRCGCPVLGLFGGADPGIPPEAVAAYDAALARAGVEHRLVTYDGAPHSFFDRKAADYEATSDSAWAEVLDFVRAHAGAVA